MEESEILEKLAALEHDQWIEWSRTLAEKENLSPERLARWKALWIPYEQLTEEMKEHDRVWARKVLAVALGKAKETLEHEFKTFEFGCIDDYVIAADLGDWNRIWRELGVE